MGFPAESGFLHGGGQEIDDEVGESTNDIPVSMRRIESEITQ